jgi:hypothetical protein
MKPERMKSRHVIEANYLIAGEGFHSSKIVILLLKVSVVDDEAEQR